MKKKSFKVLDNSKNFSQSLTINTFLLAQMLSAILYLVPNMTLDFSLKRFKKNKNKNLSRVVTNKTLQLPHFHNGGFVCGIPVGD